MTADTTANMTADMTRVMTRLAPTLVIDDAAAATILLARASCRCSLFSAMAATDMLIRVANLQLPESRRTPRSATCAPPGD
jgi:hypothetical protein